MESLDITSVAEHLEAEGFKKGVVGESPTGETQSLFTKVAGGNLYAAWCIENKPEPPTWFIGSAPFSLVRDLEGEERLEIIASFCVESADNASVITKLSALTWERGGPAAGPTGPKGLPSRGRPL